MIESPVNPNPLPSIWALIMLALSHAGSNKTSYAVVVSFALHAWMWWSAGVPITPEEQEAIRAVLKAPAPIVAPTIKAPTITGPKLKAEVIPALTGPKLETTRAEVITGPPVLPVPPTPLEFKLK